ncbi:hypothetical protein FACS189464_1800 [Bacteroidia bacterium]|nr:hypothetical protein FACS189464_1800 [Bacteroidia bacterium]
MNSVIYMEQPELEGLFRKKKKKASPSVRQATIRQIIAKRKAKKAAQVQEMQLLPDGTSVPVTTSPPSGDLVGLGLYPGMAVTTKGTNVRLRASNSATSAILLTIAASGSHAGYLTGRQEADGAYTWYQLENTPLGSGKVAWIRNDVAAIDATHATSDESAAQADLDTILRQDVQTMNNLNEASALLTTLRAKGVNTAASEKKLTDITARLQTRQTELQKSSWCKVKDKISDGWKSVKNFFGLSGLGIVPIVIIAVAAVVAGAGGTALVILKPWKDASNIDLKESKELKELLASADPTVAEKIRTDLKSQVVDAYNLGNRQGTWGSIWSIGKYVLIAGAALYFAPKVMDALNGKTEKRKMNHN